jgi:hypothetical protein
VKLSIRRGLQPRILVAYDLAGFFHDISVGSLLNRGTVDRLTVAVTAALVGVDPS